MTVDEKLDLMLSLVFCTYKRCQSADTMSSLSDLVERYQDRGEFDKAGVALDKIKKHLETVAMMDTEYVRLAGIFKRYCETHWEKVPEFIM